MEGVAKMGKERQIVAWGGTKETEPAGWRPMLGYMLGLTGKKRPKVLITGPGADETFQGYTYFRHFGQFECQMTHLSLFKAPKDLAGLVMEQDIVHVGGGNVRCMLALWRELGMDEIFREAWGKGIVLAGVSAGAICWFEECIGDEQSPLKMLGLLKGSAVPHYDSWPHAPATVREHVTGGTLKSGYAIEDESALHFVGTDLKEVVSTKEGKTAHMFGMSEGKFVMERMEAEMI